MNFELLNKILKDGEPMYMYEDVEYKNIIKEEMKK